MQRLAASLLVALVLGAGCVDEAPAPDASADGADMTQDGGLPDTPALDKTSLDAPIPDAPAADAPPVDAPHLDATPDALMLDAVPPPTFTDAGPFKDAGTGHAWDKRFVDGCAAPATALARSGDLLYVACGKTAGGLTVNGIARYNLKTMVWEALGSGVSGSGAVVRSIVIDGDDVYVGGRFATAGGVPASGLARFDLKTKTWTALGSGLACDPTVCSDPFAMKLLLLGGKLYVGGRFRYAGGTTASHTSQGIAVWDPSTKAWSNAGAGGVNGDVYTLVASGTSVYVGGSFDVALGGGVTAKHVIRYDHSSKAWTALGSGTSPGTDDRVAGLAHSGTDLYAVGRFATAGSATAKGVARYNETSKTWSAVGSGFPGGSDLRAMALYGGAVYVAGWFTTAFGAPADYLARFDGSGWQGVAAGASGGVDHGCLTVDGGKLWVGGQSLGTWDGKTWSGLTLGLVGSSVKALLASGTDVYVGGSFSLAGGRPTVNIARWSEKSGSWAALGKGVNGEVRALIVSGGSVIVGGAFTTAGGKSASRIARWNVKTQSWAALGSGVNGAVNAVASHGNLVYAAGAFTKAGGLPASSIARWDGTSWTALNKGPLQPKDAAIHALAVDSSGGLYAGGRFTTIGAATGVGSVARWDGVKWKAVGKGVGFGGLGPVHTLLVHNNGVYATGEFNMASTPVLVNIAHWDGSTWSLLGGLMTQTDFWKPIYAATLAPHGLYVTGAFTVSGSMNLPQDRLARWTGAKWVGLPGATSSCGPDKSGRAIAVMGETIFVGGEFTEVCGTSSALIARWGP